MIINSLKAISNKALSVIPDLFFTAVNLFKQFLPAIMLMAMYYGLAVISFSFIPILSFPILQFISLSTCFAIGYIIGGKWKTITSHDAFEFIEKKLSLLQDVPYIGNITFNIANTFNFLATYSFIDILDNNAKITDIINPLNNFSPLYREKESEYREEKITREL